MEYSVTAASFDAASVTANGDALLQPSSLSSKICGHVGPTAKLVRLKPDDCAQGLGIPSTVRTASNAGVPRRLFWSSCSLQLSGPPKGADAAAMPTSPF